MDTSQTTVMGWEERARAATSWEAAGWSYESQKDRMLRATGYLELNPGDAVLDYGCGLGAFRHYLPSHVRYVGVDACDAMLDRAREESGSESFFHTTDALPETTHVAALGTWNEKADGREQEAWEQIHQLWFPQYSPWPERMVLSLYAGVDCRNNAFTAEGVLRRLSHLAPRSWIIDRWRPNDIMVVVSR